MDYETLGAARKYTKDTVMGAGAIKGKDGIDGFSPIANVQRTQTGATITITDKNGTTTADIEDGNALMTVDEEFSSTSNHAIANRIVTNKFDSVDTAIAGVTNKANDNEQAIEVLNGTGEGSVQKTVANEVAKIVADAPEDFDTLKEMSDWISNHEDDAAAMNSAIQTNASNINTLQASDAKKAEGEGIKFEIDVNGNLQYLYDDGE